MRKKHIVDVLFVFSLFCIFAIASMFVVILGANSYKKNADVYDKNFSERTSILYVLEKIHQNDVPGGIRLDFVEYVQALVLTQNINGYAYETWIYVYDDELHEVLVERGTKVSLNDGQVIMPLKSLNFSLSNGMLVIAITDISDNNLNMSVKPRCAVITEASK